MNQYLFIRDLYPDLASAAQNARARSTGSQVRIAVRGTPNWWTVVPAASVGLDSDVIGTTSPLCEETHAGSEDTDPEHGHWAPYGKEEVTICTDDRDLSAHWDEALPLGLFAACDGWERSEDRDSRE